MGTGQVLLELRAVSAFYGAFKALENLHLNVNAGEIVALLGGNASGKSTTLKTILGMVPYTGAILYEGAALEGTPTHKRVAAGIATVPEGRRLFPNMTVEENLLVGENSKWCAIDDSEWRGWVFRLFPVLRERFASPAGQLSGGEQQMLAFARALLMRPKLLLLDEPSMGLAPSMVLRNCDVLEEVAKRGTAVLLVEQHANVALAIAQYAYVLRQGRIVMKGAPEVLTSSEVFRKAYLGKE